MKKILVIGAGKSSSVLIKYLLNNAAENNWRITIADSDLKLASSKLNYHQCGSAIEFNVYNEMYRTLLISEHDLIISLLPPSLHYLVAKCCANFGKHLITASYTPQDIWDLNEEAKNNGSLILMEMGLDPGIDHMSAMKIINEIKSKGGMITSFKSYCGGLIAPESDNNPWNYKFTWNPKNVVLAGQGTSKYMDNGSIKYVPYHKIFSRTEKIEIYENIFEGYVNRDSLKYLELYKLYDVKTFIRGTLRKEGFCNSWNVFVQLGMTDDGYQINCRDMSYKQFFHLFTNNIADWGVDIDNTSYDKLEWLGLFSDEKIKFDTATPAQILQEILEKKLSLDPLDKDMIVMQHQIEYNVNRKNKKLSSSLMCIGDNSIDTAMSKTVGLPMGIAAKLILENKISLSGVYIPTISEIYQPVLEELGNFGIIFKE